MPKTVWETPQLWRVYEVSATMRVQRPTMGDDPHLVVVRQDGERLRVEANEVRYLIEALVHAGGDLAGDA